MMKITGSVNALVQSIGIGGLKPNTLLLSWPTREVGKDEAADSEYQTFTGQSELLLYIIKNICCERKSKALYRS